MFKNATLRRLFLTCSVLACLLLASSASWAQKSPVPIPINSLGIHTMVLTETGEFYLFLEAPVGSEELSKPYSIAALVDFASLFPTSASFDTFNNYSESQKQSALLGTMYYVDWDSLNLNPDSIIAQGTVLLDLNESDYSVLQSQFEDHMGAMAEAWHWVLENPFSASDGKLNIEGLVSDGELLTEETWAVVGEWIGTAASAAWNGGKYVANKILPVGQAIELCVTATNIVGTSISNGELPAVEDLTELCFDAAECVPGGWGIGAAAAHEAWCWLDW